MDHMIIDGSPPYNGRYELDWSQDLTTREWGWIKRLAGYLPLTLTDEAFGDPEFACALAVIALRRAGKIQSSEVPRVFDRLAEAPFGSTIRFEGEPEQEDAEEGRPPPPSSSSNGAISGGASPTSSGPPAVIPRLTGTPASATSVSAPATLVS